MSEMDGLETIKEIKRLDPSTEILVISSSSSKYDTIDAIGFGASDYIVKPFDRNLVGFRIVKMLREKANIDQSKKQIDMIFKKLQISKNQTKESATKNYLRR